MRKQILVSFCIFGLAACNGGGGGAGGGGGGTTTTGAANFAPSAIPNNPVVASAISTSGTSTTGEITIQGFGKLEYSANLDAMGNGTLAAAPAGNGSLPALSAPTSGTATMNGIWGLTQINGNTIDTDTGAITLRAEFDAPRTLRGNGNGLQFNGTISGSAVGGTVVYGGEAAALDGVIGASSSAGVFVGSTYSGAYAVAK